MMSCFALVDGDGVAFGIQDNHHVADGGLERSHFNGDVGSFEFGECCFYFCRVAFAFGGFQVVHGLFDFCWIYFEDAAIIEAQTSVIGGEDFQGLNAHLHQRRNRFRDLLIEAGEIHMEGIVDGGFFGFLHPQINRIFKAFVF